MLKKHYEKLYYTKNCIIFVLLKEMEKKKQIDVTEKEADLIAAIRNYVKSYPDGYPRLLDYAQRIFDELVDPFAM